MFCDGNRCGLIRCLFLAAIGLLLMVFPHDRTGADPWTAALTALMVAVAVSYAYDLGKERR